MRTPSESSLAGKLHEAVLSQVLRIMVCVRGRDFRKSEISPGRRSARGITRHSIALVISSLVLSIHPAVAQVATPTLVQSASASNVQGTAINAYKLRLPNTTLAGNAVIGWCQFSSGHGATAVTAADDKNNTYVPVFPQPGFGDGNQNIQALYALNVAPGARNITFSFIGGTPTFISCASSEYYNVATSSAFDGSAQNGGTGSLVTAGSFTPTVDGDLVFQAAINDNPGQVTGSWTQGSSPWILLTADLTDGTASQYQVQATQAAINPTLSMSPAGTFLSVTFALKSANTGTPPSPGIRIVHQQDYSFFNITAYNAAAMPFAFPSTGNLMIAAVIDNYAYNVASITDTAGNVWASSGPVVSNSAGGDLQISYAPNATTSSTLTGTFHMAGPGQAQSNIMLFDAVGADISPLDLIATNSNSQLIAGDLTAGSITPATANGLVVAESGFQSGTCTGSSPVIGYFVSANTSPEGSDNPVNQNNCWNVNYNTDTSAETYTWTTTGGPINPWTFYAAAFKAASRGPDTLPPSIPANLATVATSSTAINLSWSASTDDVAVAGYHVFRDGVQLATTTNAAYADTGLQAATTYAFAVDAFDAAGNISAQSASTTATTLAPDVTPPIVAITSPLNGTIVSGTVAIAANASDDVAVKSVQFQIDGINFGPADTTAPFQTTWNTAVPNNGSHTITAIATDTSGNSAASLVSLTVNNFVDVTPPSLPANLSASATSTSQINLAWSASTDDVAVTGYKVFRNGAQVMTTTTNVSSADTGLAASTTYTYAVRAFDAAGNVSAQSATAAGTTFALPPPPPFVFVQGASTAPNVGSPLSIKFANVSAVNNLIISGGSWGGRTGNITCTDSAGSVFTNVPAFHDTVNNQSQQICYAVFTKASASSDTVKVAFPNGNYTMMFATEYSGLATLAVLDVSSGKTAPGCSSANCVNSNTSITRQADLIFGVGQDDSGNHTTITPGTGFTPRLFQPGYSFLIEDMIKITPGPVSATFTFAAPNRSLVTMAAFKIRN
jgi:chitodextrinase